jgi:hypothetical protein
LRTYYVPFLLALLLSGCLCGIQVVGDAGGDSGIHRDGGVDAGDAGLDGGDAGIDGGDAGIDCSTMCTIGSANFCAYQLDPSGNCSQCIPSDSSSSWSSAPIGTPCKIQNPPPGIPPIGACWLPPLGAEECTCAVNGSRCWAPTSCCSGACVDGGCYGDPATLCEVPRIPCLRGICCTDGGAGAYGICSDDGGTCPE